jgi:hypothetical protein
MIAPIEKPKRHDNVPEWHKCLLQMLPQIIRNARHAFKDLPAEARQDAIAEVIANCTVAVARLAQRNLLDLAYPTPLSLFAIRQYFVGRRVGNKIASRDVYSQQARERGGFEVCHLGTPREQRSEDWREQLVENRRTTPADLACFKLDFPRWLESLSPRDRKIAELLSTGESTGRTARRFRISAGRVSQIRTELRRRWLEFHGELDGIAVAAT